MIELIDFLQTGLLNLSGWQLVLYTFIVVQLTLSGVSLFLHREQTHRGIKMHPVIQHFYRFWTWFTTGMLTKEWVAIHRKHHAKCETNDDPHSPVAHGIGTVVLHGVALYQRCLSDREMIDQYGLNCPNDWIERNLYTRFSTLGVALLLVLSVTAFGAIGLTVWALQMLAMPVLAAGIINGLGHWWGYRNYETNDCSTNLTPWAVLLGGEELHNNHHAFPSSARFAMRKAEFDIGWSMIQLAQRLKLATVLRVAPGLDIGPAREPDTDTLRALVSHRYQVLKHYFKEVTLPVMRSEVDKASRSASRLGRRLRRALANDGRWLDADAQARLRGWVAEHPSTATVVEYRRRLADLMARSGKSSQAMLEALRQWCAEAEASGIEALEEFSRKLRSYALPQAAAA